jgi:hypothetical protein
LGLPFSGENLKKVLFAVIIVRNFVIAFRSPHSHIRAFPKTGCSETGYDIHIGEYRPIKKEEKIVSK